MAGRSTGYYLRDGSACHEGKSGEVFETEYLSLLYSLWEEPRDSNPWQIKAVRGMQSTKPFGSSAPREMPSSSSSVWFLPRYWTPISKNASKSKIQITARDDLHVVVLSKDDREHGNYSCTFMLTGDIDGGVPNFQPPPFSIPANASGLGLDEIGFGEMVKELGAAIIIIPIIAILESIAIAKAFCKSV